MKKLALFSVLSCLLLSCEPGFKTDFLNQKQYAIYVGSPDLDVNYDIIHYDYAKNDEKTTYILAKGRRGYFCNDNFECGSCWRTKKHTIELLRHSGSGTIYLMFDKGVSNLNEFKITAENGEEWTLCDLVKNEEKGISAPKPYAEYYKELSAVKIDSTVTRVTIDFDSENPEHRDISYEYIAK